VAAEQQLMAATKAIADRREGLAKLRGQVEAARSRTTAAADEIARLSAAEAEARERAEAAQAAYAQAAEGASEQDRDTAELDIAHEQAQAVMEEASQAVNTLAAAEREAEKECTQWQAREEALSLGLRRRDGAGALLAAGD